MYNKLNDTRTLLRPSLRIPTFVIYKSSPIPSLILCSKLYERHNDTSHI